MKSRLSLPTPASMTFEQQAIYAEVLRTRGNASGPFLAWLLNPKLADPAQQLGAFCRYGTSLSLQESELLICLVAVHYDCLAERAIHEPIARKAGLSEAALVSIRAGVPPALQPPRLQLLADLGRELLAHKKLPDELYEEAVAQLGEQTLVEVVGIVGYYAFVAYTLNAFDMKLG